MDSLILGLRVLVALGAVLGLLWLLQRRLGKGTGLRREDRTLTVVSRQPVGPKASVVVLDADGQRFLLGVTEHAVSVLSVGDIPARADEPEISETPRNLADFGRILAEVNPLSRSQGGLFSAALTGTGTRTEAETEAVLSEDSRPGPDGVSGDLPLPRRSSIHRSSTARSSGSDSELPALHGSIFSGSTWEQAAAALRSGRRR